MQLYMVLGIFTYFSLCPEVSSISRHAVHLQYLVKVQIPWSPPPLPPPRPPPQNILIDGSGMRPRNLHLKIQPRRFCCNGSFEKHGLEEGNTQGFLAEARELHGRLNLARGAVSGYCPSVSVGALASSLAGLSRRCISVSLWKAG